MKAMIKYLLAVIAIVFIPAEAVFSQTAYKLPFASSNNRIELTVTNSSTITAKNVTVAVDSVPSWIKMKEETVSAGELAAKGEKAVTFTFDVDKKAPVGSEGTIKFKISSLSGEQWSKEIKVTAGAPDKFELFQNYPNPFNPTTTISYQLASDSKVVIKIYNILGEEVKTMFDGIQKAGYYENRFNANRIASGMYIYRLTAKSSEGKSSEYCSIKKMMVIK
jgi:flagellar hook assembly protein FlgD